MMTTFGHRSFTTVGFALIAAAVSPALAQAPEDSPPAAAPQSGTPERTVRRVDSFAHVAAFLNLAQGTVRIVLIVPTDKMASIAAVDTLTAVVRSIPSKRLRAYVIMRGGEVPLQAAVLAGHAADSRMVCFWDANGAAASTWEAGATVDAGAWLYDTSAVFAHTPPAPELATTAPARAPLDATALRARADELVRRVEAKIARTRSGSQ